MKLEKIKQHIINDGAFSTVNKSVVYLYWQLVFKVRQFKLDYESNKINKIFALDSIEDRFNKIAKINYWGNRESISGPGSTIENTKNLRHELPNIFKSFGVKVVFDAPCGDFNWMKSVVEMTDITYVGGDIVKSIVEGNGSRNSDCVTEFVHFDITKGSFPKADLWICRDCLFHFSYDDTILAIERYLESKIPYMLTSTHKNLEVFDNTDIKTGSFRLIDLFSRPYYFSNEPLLRIDDSFASNAPREICMWSHKQILDAHKKFSKAIID